MKNPSMELPENLSGSMHAAPDAVYRKVGFRLVPFLFFVYVLCFIARINISFAQLQFKADLQFSDAVYGFGAGLFYVGYILFEVPSNLLLERIGARRTIARIMILWGVVAVSMLFIKTPMQFYAARFLLGVAEAGFFPGIILYLTFWYPSGRRGGVIAIFLSATAVAGIISAPLSTWILASFNGTHGLHGWQWMFMLEGLPSILFGVIAFFYLSDKPEQAAWLSDDEKGVIAADLRADQEQRKLSKAGKWRSPFLDPRVYLVSFVYFAMASAFAVFVFWFPSMVKSLDQASLQLTGLISMIPYIAALAGMIWVGRRSDLKLERRWHIAVCIAVAAAALLLTTLLPVTLVSLVLLQVIFAGAINGAAAVFWTVPTAYLPAATAAGGIALISSIGQLGNFFSPALLGWIKTETGSLSHGIWIMVALLCLAALVLLASFPQHLIQERRQAAP
jgi:D-galactonate transporter